MTTMTVPDYASAIRAAREALEWTQARLARELGVSEGTIRNWESGRTMPHGAALAGLARVLGTTVEALDAGETEELPLVEQMSALVREHRLIRRYLGLPEEGEEELVEAVRRMDARRTTHSKAEQTPAELVQGDGL